MPDAVQPTSVPAPGPEARLAGRVAIVSGASSGIGKATAQELARLGAAVVLVARGRDKLDAAVAEIEAAGGKACAVEPTSPSLRTISGPWRRPSTAMAGSTMR